MKPTQRASLRDSHADLRLVLISLDKLTARAADPETIAELDNCKRWTHLSLVWIHDVFANDEP
jgi:hypothetical protein